ncbi:MAG TPA: Ger(x)C family spore germination protein [Syntrophothermus lipocalidus]|uniref:Germination protein, Ger(X)C family n=1 Tax=Syntrophothermus lipocalidus (strain DSM 12680 / TGB-C1) TaxID=643648 RepID=D7CJW8_SYNLT|nr:Ger(x)C family spore germination protein [Syntrophothermus lipocalidus]ADI01082.1 germination protein, Ger(x)C family [Syntrophothermus lipocalidus DSM 12680]HHV77607.1 Ger(x)C family spore germination protein [Syntrophothermus lipocalidus]HOV42847.1 Ger(x)C family spore germination protein [Syntrophothermus lipocalidus]
MNAMTRKYLILLVVLVSLGSVSGCWDSREINDNFVVVAIGWDAAAKRHLMFTEQIAEMPPQAGKQKGAKTARSSPTFVTVSRDGRSLTEGPRNVHLRQPRSPLWQHAYCYLLGEDLCRQGLSGAVDYFLRNRNIRKTGYLFVARNSTAAQVLQVPTEVEKLPGPALVSMIKNQDLHIGIYTPTDMGDFLTKTITPGIEPAVPGVEIVNENGKKALHLSGMAVFKEGRLVGWLDEEESRGYRWLRPTPLAGGTKLVKCPFCGKPVLLDTTRSQCRIKPRISDGRIIITIDIKEEGNFYEQTCSHQLLTPKTLPQLEQQAAQLITRQVRAAVNKAQSLDSDIFGFGQAVFESYPKEWASLESKWAQVFPTLEVEIHVKSEIRRSYLTTETLQYRF